MNESDFVAIVSYLTGLVPVFLALSGWGALVAVAINVLKVLGVVKDGQAPKFNLIFNVGGLVLLMGLGLLRNVTPEQFDAVAAAVAGLLVAVLGFVMQFKAAATTHVILSNSQVPVIGKSYTPPLGNLLAVGLGEIRTAHIGEVRPDKDEPNDA